MKQGFIKVAAVTVDIRVADVWHNCKEICKRMKEAEKAGAKIIVFPELCLTGYTCSDLFTQDILLKEVRRALAKVAEETRHTYRQRSVRMSGHQSRRALRRQEKARSSWSTVQQVMRRSERIVTGRN